MGSGYDYGTDKAKGGPAILATRGSDGSVDVATTDSGLPVMIKTALAAFSSLWKLNYSDITTRNDWGSSNGGSAVFEVSDVEQMFDNNPQTHGTIAFGATATAFAKVHISPIIPMFSEAIFMFVRSGNIAPLYAVYADGTREELSFTKERAIDIGYYELDLYKYYPRTDKRVTDFYFDCPGGNAYDFDVYEMNIYVSPHRSSLTAGMDITKPNTPQADTEYSAEIMVKKDNNIVISALCDQTPSSIVLEGSNDGTDYHEFEGTGFDLSSWSTTNYNTLTISPYTRYVRVRLKTPSTAPGALEISIKEMES